MEYLFFFCVSINWFVMSICTSDISEDKLQTLSTFSENIQKDTSASNFENLNSLLPNNEMSAVGYFKQTRAIGEPFRGSSKVEVNVNELNGQTEHTGYVKKENYKPGYVKRLNNDQSSSSLDNLHQLNPMYILYVFPLFRRRPITRISELYRMSKPLTFKQFEPPIEIYGPHSEAGSSLYGAYASAQIGIPPVGEFGYNEESFEFEEGSEEEK